MNSQLKKMTDAYTHLPVEMFKPKDVVKFVSSEFTGKQPGIFNRLIRLVESHVILTSGNYDVSMNKTGGNLFDKLQEIDPSLLDKYVYPLIKQIETEIAHEWAKLTSEKPQERKLKLIGSHEEESE